MANIFSFHWGWAPMEDLRAQGGCSIVAEGRYSAMDRRELLEGGKSVCSNFEVHLHLISVFILQLL